MKSRIILPLLLVFSTVAIAIVSIQCRKKTTDFQKPVSSAKDTLLYSFAVIGCNRLDNSDITSNNTSTANINQLRQSFTELAIMNPVPNYLFMAGDIIYGYSSDTNQLKNELTAWEKLYESSPLALTGIKLVALPGNHEVMSGKNKPAYQGAEQAWLSIMKPYIAGNNGPKTGDADHMITDQSSLTYSFDYLNTHFIVLNTDPVGKEADIPVKWVTDDINNAKMKGAKHIFAIGHKPAYPFPPEDGIDVNIQDRNQFWAAMESNKAEAMIAAHNHVYYRTQPDAGKTWQIISGNGGSPLSGNIASDKQQYFGYVVVSVYTSGKVISTSYGRDVPSGGYNAQFINTPTTVRDSLDITFK